MKDSHNAIYVKPLPTKKNWYEALQEETKKFVALKNF